MVSDAELIDGSIMQQQSMLLRPSSPFWSAMRSSAEEQCGRISSFFALLTQSALLLLVVVGGGGRRAVVVLTPFVRPRHQ